MRSVINFILIIGLIITAGFLVQKYVAAKDTNGVAQEAFTELNSLRVEIGCQPLQWDNELEKLAIAHSQKMSDTNSLEHSGLPYAENILRGAGMLPGVSAFDNGHQIIQPWNMSLQHSLIMVDSRYTKGAIGIVGNYATFLAQ